MALIIFAGSIINTEEPIPYTLVDRPTNKIVPSPRRDHYFDRTNKRRIVVRRPS